jgi:hypothetical protein
MFYIMMCCTRTTTRNLQAAGAPLIREKGRHKTQSKQSCNLITSRTAAEHCQCRRAVGAYGGAWWSRGGGKSGAWGAYGGAWWSRSGGAYCGTYCGCGALPLPSYRWGCGTYGGAWWSRGACWDTYCGATTARTVGAYRASPSNSRKVVEQDNGLNLKGSRRREGKRRLESIGDASKRMHRQESALHPNECNGGDSPGPLSRATRKEGARRAPLEERRAAVERRMKVRKATDPKQHDGRTTLRESVLIPNR